MRQLALCFLTVVALTPQATLVWGIIIYLYTYICPFINICDIHLFICTLKIVRDGEPHMCIVFVWIIGSLVNVA